MQKGMRGAERLDSQTHRLNQPFQGGADGGIVVHHEDEGAEAVHNSLSFLGEGSKSESCGSSVLPIAIQRFRIVAGAFNRRLPADDVYTFHNTPFAMYSCELWKAFTSLGRLSHKTIVVWRRITRGELLLQLLTELVFLLMWNCVS
jgi:hypothetical protein